MGYYIAASNLRTRSGTRTAEITFKRAIRDYESWDVFLAHRSSDDQEALRIADLISKNGLSVWIDDADPHIFTDTPHLAEYIRDVMRASGSLLALVTHSTVKSWWVPFEIGLAFDQQKFIATYSRNVPLPSYLTDWPNLQTDEDLAKWCNELQQSVASSNYAGRMAILASRF